MKYSIPDISFIINYEYTKMNSENIYLFDYFKWPEKKSKVSENVIINHGIFTIKYTTNNIYAHNTFGLNGGIHCHTEIVVEFYENDILLFTKSTKKVYSIVLHGDGITKEKTFFSFHDTKNNNRYDCLAVFNMNNQYIKQVCIGVDCFAEFKRVNDKYAIGFTVEMCCHAPFTALFDLDLFFDLKECDPDIAKIRPYDKSRHHIPLTVEASDGPIAMTPLIATPKGFIVKVNSPVTYQFTEENLVTYDDAFNGIADFYEDVPTVDIFDVLNSFGMTNSQQQQIDEALSTGQTVSIGFDKLNDDQKNSLVDKIANAYAEINKTSNKST